MQLTPFARGPAPGIYADYDDWRGLRWGFCETLAGESVALAPAPYNNGTRCGPVQRYPEPVAGGGMGIIATPGSNDRTLHPWLYAYDDYSCEQ